LIALACGASARSRSFRGGGGFWSGTGRTYPAGTTSARSTRLRWGGSVPMSCCSAPRARISRSPGAALDWRGRAVGSSSRRHVSSGSAVRLSLFGRMFLVPSQALRATTSGRSLTSWPTAGRWTSSGVCWTADTGESHSGAVECSLSQILEENVPSKYFLSQKAAAGILRRAERRGRELPPALREALLRLAGSTPPGGDAKTTRT
jgi:hypothetical protein